MKSDTELAKRQVQQNTFTDPLYRQTTGKVSHSTCSDSNVRADWIRGRRFPHNKKRGKPRRGGLRLKTSASTRFRSTGVALA